MEYYSIEYYNLLTENREYYMDVVGSKFWCKEEIRRLKEHKKKIPLTEGEIMLAIENGVHILTCYIASDYKIVKRNLKKNL